MGEQPARWVHLAQFMDISGFRGVFGGEIGSVTSKHFRLDDNGIPVYIPYPSVHGALTCWIQCWENFSWLRNKATVTGPISKAQATTREEHALPYKGSVTRGMGGINAMLPVSSGPPPSR